MAPSSRPSLTDSFTKTVTPLSMRRIISLNIPATSPFGVPRNNFSSAMPPTPIPTTANTAAEKAVVAAISCAFSSACLPLRPDFIATDNASVKDEL